MSATDELPDSVEPHLPGETGVWMFIIGDVLVFSLLFAVFVYDRSQEVALFVEQQQLLNQTFGLVNTLLLLTSSWFVVLAVHRPAFAGPRLFRVGNPWRYWFRRPQIF